MDASRPDGCWTGEWSFDRPITAVLVQHDDGGTRAGLLTRSAWYCGEDDFGGYGWESVDVICDFRFSSVGSTHVITTQDHTLGPFDSTADLVGQSFTSFTHRFCDEHPGEGSYEYQETPLTGAITIASIQDGVARLEVDIDDTTGTLWGYACEQTVDDGE